MRVARCGVLDDDDDDEEDVDDDDDVQSKRRDAPSLRGWVSCGRSARERPYVHRMTLERFYYP